MRNEFVCTRRPPNRGAAGESRGRFQSRRDKTDASNRAGAAFGSVQIRALSDRCHDRLAQRTKFPAGRTPGVAVQRVSAVDNASTTDDPAEELRVDFAELVPLSQEENGIGIAGGSHSAVGILELRMS